MTVTTLPSVPAATEQHDAALARGTGAPRTGRSTRPARRTVPHTQPRTQAVEAFIARQERIVAAAQRRAAERTHGLTELLESRPDLRGTHAPADFAVEAVLWAV